MSLYFKDEMKEEKKLSEYLEPELKEEKEEIRGMKLSQYLEKDENEFKGNIFSQNERIARTEYIMEILGDVSLEKDIYNLFIIMFQRICTKYDVLTKSIKNVSDAIGSLTPTSISTVERVISDSKAKIEKMPQNMRLGALKQMFIKTNSGVDDDYYNGIIASRSII